MSRSIMFEAGPRRHAAPAALAVLDPVPPRWVHDAFGSTHASLDLGPHLDGVASNDLVLLKTTIDQARCLSDHVLRHRVTEAYQHIGLALTHLGRTPIRFWNFIPDPGMTMAPGVDRYMVFNAGRYDALSTESAAGAGRARSWATASAVGVDVADLVVYCLASKTPSTAVENPRQTSAWLYSARYGPRPPCFARATIATINGAPRLLIGGTASIVGEDSQHGVDAAAQLDETLKNVASVVVAARRMIESTDQALARVIDARVYVTSDSNARIIQREIGRRLVRASRVEFVRARICRPELLLEIEGVAEM